MQNNFLPPVTLRRVSASTGNVVTETATIADNGYSEGISGQDCRELIFVITLPANGDGGNITIEACADNAWVADTFIAWMVRALSTRLLILSTHEFISPAGTEPGARPSPVCNYRVKNETGQIATVTVHRRIA